MTDVTDFIGAAVADKPVKALKAFSAAMEPRISDALDAHYSKVSHAVFNPPQEVADEVEDVELEATDEIVDEVEVEEPEVELETEMEEPQDV
jgi:hypothetical protein